MKTQPLLWQGYYGSEFLRTPEGRKANRARLLLINFLPRASWDLQENILTRKTREFYYIEVQTKTEIAKRHLIQYLLNKQAIAPNPAITGWEDAYLFQGIPVGFKVLQAEGSP